MQTVSIHEAKTHLSRLIKLLEGGEEIIITNSGKPVGKLVPLEKPKKRIFGDLEHVAHLYPFPDDFNDPIPEEWFLNDPNDPLNKL